MAKAFRLAIGTKGLEGRSEAFNICADDNPSRFDSREFIRIVGWSEVPLKKDIEGRGSLFDWSKAERLLGYRPTHSWHDSYIKGKREKGGDK